MNVIGLDLSLTSTGIAHSADCGHARIVTRPNQTLEERIGHITREVLGYAITADLVVIEALPPKTVTGNGFLDRAQLIGHVRMRLYDTRTPVLWVPPATLKTYATGKGNAPKDAVLAEAIRRFAYTGVSNDEADALILRQIGCALVGHPDTIPVPESHRRALGKLTLPTLTLPTSEATP